MKPTIKIKYDGKWPCLCSGRLSVWVDDTYYDFGKHCLNSGGTCMLGDDGDYHTTHGLWEIDEESIPNDFPRDLLGDLLNEINEEIPLGCCGGCI